MLTYTIIQNCMQRLIYDTYEHLKSKVTIHITHIQNLGKKR